MSRKRFGIVERQEMGDETSSRISTGRSLNATDGQGHGPQASSAALGDGPLQVWRRWQDRLPVAALFSNSCSIPTDSCAAPCQPGHQLEKLELAAIELVHPPGQAQPSMQPQLPPCPTPSCQGILASDLCLPSVTVRLSQQWVATINNNAREKLRSDFSTCCISQFIAHSTEAHSRIIACCLRLVDCNTTAAVIQ